MPVNFIYKSVVALPGLFILELTEPWLFLPEMVKDGLEPMSQLKEDLVSIIYRAPFWHGLCIF
jgi:hypothetical protein